MISNQQDWKRLRTPILLLGLVVILSALLAYYAYDFASQKQTALQAQQNLLKQAHQKYLSSGQERETIVKYLPLYQRLITSGFIGEEQRIEWIEKLRQIHLRHKLFSIEYNIGQQETINPDYLTQTGQFTLKRSVMKLNMGILHEADLLTLLDGLREQPTPFIVRECELVKPVGSKINTNVLTTNIQANCEIDWLTLREPQQGEAR
ncbi:MAG TPA: hypothetical protein DCO68_07900 [Methylophilaceae bacterium]|nr:hypothetical protein [Methylophilaceae bacterium]HAJ71990.1 hypothetical protein [Methylophilaceae bacterium]